MQTEVVPIERIASRIFLVRGQKVMLDADLAELCTESSQRTSIWLYAETHGDSRGILCSSLILRRRSL